MKSHKSIFNSSKYTLSNYQNHPINTLATTNNSGNNLKQFCMRKKKKNTNFYSENVKLINQMNYIICQLMNLVI